MKFPHSLGLFYLALTQYLGFPKYGDEYKVMGMSAYGEPSYMNEMNQVLKIADGKNGPLFELDLDYFIHHSEGVAMTWQDGEPKMGPVFSSKMEKLFGSARQPDEEIEQKHKGKAAAHKAHRAAIHRARVLKPALERIETLPAKMSHVTSATGKCPIFIGYL